MTPAPRRRDRSAETLSPRRRREDLVRPLAGLAVALFLVVCVLAGGIGYLAVDARKIANRAEQTARVAGRNTLALRVGCIVLSNTIIRAGAGGRRPATPAGRAQTELTRYVYIAVNRGLNPTERARVARLQAIIRKAGGVVELPPCDDIALHPERVKSLISALPARPLAPPVHPNP